MRPTKLTMSAFGPFCDLEVIDLDRAAKTGIFLISGKTGAGKTTIFDAITFALYGRASGSSRRSENFRSNSAPVDRECYVELVFLLDDREYTIRRRPKQELGKKRGEGTKIAEQRAELTLPDGTVIDSLTEVNAKVIQLLGIDCEQFRRIIMLAQGEFRQLLDAPSRTKMELFRKIFGTVEYDSFTKELERQRKQLTDRWQRGLEARKRLIDNLAANGIGELAEVENAQHLPAKTLGEIIGSRIDEQEKHLTDCTKKLEKLEQEREAISINEARSLAEKFAQRDRLTQEIAQLAAQKPEAVIWESRLRLAGEAKLIHLREQQWIEAKKRLAELTRQLEQQKAAAAGAKEARQAALLEQGKNPERQKRLEELAGDVVLCRQIAILTRGLVEGMPCPVCGATSHPVIADDRDGDLYHLEKDIKAKTDRLEQEQKKLRQQIDRCQKNVAEAGELVTRTETRVAQITETIAGQQREIIEKKQLVVDAMKESGFSDRKMYEAALQDLELETKLKEQLENYRNRSTAAAVRLETVTGELAGKALPDMVALQQRHDRLAEEKKRLTQQVMEQKGKLELCRNQWQRLEQELTESAGVEEQLAAVTGLSRCASGDNPMSVTFETYILTAYFKDIIKVSNQHLGRMTDGRYQLLHMEEKAGFGASSGLDLEVWDNNSGKKRPVTTLSGGESFKASLALALGLADVVRLYSGSIRLDTLFIDEGFGTLDSSSLDSAVDTLLSLRREGRLVGVISHVEGLGERLGTVLEVTATQTGSTARFL